MGSRKARGISEIGQLLIVGFDGTEIIGLIALLVILRHHANIRRLLRGEESKIELSSKPE